MGRLLPKVSLNPDSGFDAGASGLMVTAYSNMKLTMEMQVESPRGYSMRQGAG
jgi:hypothetical protein